MSPAFAIAFIGVLTMSSCSDKSSSALSMTALINREQGAVAVWRSAQYGGGEFNGFDNDARFIERADYSAFSLREVAAGLESTPVPVDYAFRGASTGPAQDFVVANGKIVASGCAPLPGSAPVEGADQCNAAVLGLFQLGGRGEHIRADGVSIVVARADGGACSIASGAPGGSSIAVASFPSAGVVYMERDAESDPALYVSTGCGAFVPVDLSAVSAMMDEEGRRDVRLRDVVPGSDPTRPILLLDWTSLVQGVYRQRTGAFDIAQGRLLPLPEEVELAVGFWNSSPTQVLVEHRVTDGQEAALTLMIYDFDRSGWRLLSAITPQP